MSDNLILYLIIAALVAYQFLPENIKAKVLVGLKKGKEVADQVQDNLEDAKEQAGVIMDKANALKDQVNELKDKVDKTADKIEQLETETSEEVQPVALAEEVDKEQEQEIKKKKKKQDE